jgi:predicted transcriptional regulator of viral defense system
MPHVTKTDLVLQHVQRLGVARPKDLARQGIAPVYLSRMCQRGLLTQVARGLYTVAGHEPTAHHTMVVVSKRVPRGVICLLTALRFHDIGTQNPADVWLAVERKAQRPSVAGLPVRVVRFSGAALNEGVEEHVIEGVTVRMTNPAKTVVDCFKYRHKLGLDVALEALREGWRSRKLMADDLWRYAKLCRVANVIRPYMEAVAVLFQPPLPIRRGAEAEEPCNG